jgi:CBS domain-containing membrane protein
MRLLNDNFIHHKAHFLLQCLIIVFFLAAVLFPLGALRASVVTAIGASTLASSIFAIFAAPKAAMSAIHRVLGGYTIGILVGLFWHQLFQHFNAQMHQNPLDHTLTIDLCGSLAVGTAMLIMAMLDLIHTPPVGFALALAIAPWNYWVICVVIAAVLVLCLIKYLLRNWFINLL